MITTILIAAGIILGIVIGLVLMGNAINYAIMSSIW